jgi:hypothetical protein
MGGDVQAVIGTWGSYGIGLDMHLSGVDLYGVLAMVFDHVGTNPY